MGVGSHVSLRDHMVVVLELVVVASGPLYAVVAVLFALAYPQAAAMGPQQPKRWYFCRILVDLRRPSPSFSFFEYGGGPLHLPLALSLPFLKALSLFEFQLVH